MSKLIFFLLSSPTNPPINYLLFLRRRQVNRTLQSLDIHNNKITLLPLDWCFDNLVLSEIKIDALVLPPVKDGEQLMVYIRDLQRGATRPDLVNVMLVGHGGAGKTTLKNRVLLLQNCLPTGYN